MPKIRIHLLLEPNQRHILAQIALRQGRSMSAVAREIIQEGIEKRQSLQALEKARQVRQAIFTEHSSAPLSLDIPMLMDELRNDRDDHILRHPD